MDVIGKLNGAMVEALADPAMRARLAELGLDVASREQQTPQGLADFHKAEVDKWWPILKAANIKGECSAPSGCIATRATARCDRGPI